MARLQALVGLMIGLTLGVCYSFGGAFYDLFYANGFNKGTALAFMALIAMPLIFSVIGLLIGTITAILYNVFAAKFGGLSFNLIVEEKR